MAKNDIVLLDGIIDERLASEIPSKDSSECFEFFVLEQLLKDYDLSNEELESGWVDGGDDGGIDGAYIFINGHLLEHSEDFAWPKSGASIELWLVTCKHHATFQQATLDALIATIQELFDFALENSDLKGQYSQDILAFRALARLAYRKLSIGHPKMSLQVVYASRGDTKQIGQSVSARSSQIESSLAGMFSSAFCKFRFVGATELVELHRRIKKFAIDLPFLEYVATEKSGYVLLVRLGDYWKFVTDENGNLRRYLFDSNVRDYLGSNAVNEEIARSLADPEAPDFWWLNNGVTILATNATAPGKLVQLQDIQIVNGLQTTETIFEHFSSGSNVSKERSLLVKVVVSSDSQIRDQIIRATNNQSLVETAALHATDKIQRDIEMIRERNGWYYERRKNYFRNIGKPPSRLVTPLYIASAAIALVMKNPARATKLRARFMRNQASYDAVFAANMPIEIWPALVNVFKSIDSGLQAHLKRGMGGEGFISRWRSILALLLVARRMGTFSYTSTQLAELRAVTIADADFLPVWAFVQKFTGDQFPRKPSEYFVNKLCEAAELELKILGREAVGRRVLPTAPSFLGTLTSDFVNRVEMLLPLQPWKPGVHLDIASKLDSKPEKVSKAIQHLISEGRRNRQKDGVVFDKSGKVIAVDSDRIPYSPEEINMSPTLLEEYRLVE